MFTVWAIQTKVITLSIQQVAFKGMKLMKKLVNGMVHIIYLNRFFVATR